jgi:RNA polymerase sigma-70 factor (ECF subfamily)
VHDELWDLGSDPLAQDSEMRAPHGAPAEGGEGRVAVNAAMDRYARGDDAAFTELYDLLAPKLHNFLLRQTRDRPHADDLLQQTLLRMHRARGHFAPGGEATAWAFSIARRLMIDSYRRSKREETRKELESVEEAPESASSTEDVLHRRRIARIAERELARLPESQRVAFELVKKEGLSLREVAQILGITTNAAKQRAHRAYVALRSAITQQIDEDALGRGVKS